MVLWELMSVWDSKFIARNYWPLPVSEGTAMRVHEMYRNVMYKQKRMRSPASGTATNDFSGSAIAGNGGLKTSPNTETSAGNLSHRENLQGFLDSSPLAGLHKARPCGLSRQTKTHDSSTDSRTLPRSDSFVGLYTSSNGVNAMDIDDPTPGLLQAAPRHPAGLSPVIDERGTQSQDKTTFTKDEPGSPKRRRLTPPEKKANTAKHIAAGNKKVADHFNFFSTLTEGEDEHEHGGGGGKNMDGKGGASR